MKRSTFLKLLAGAAVSPFLKGLDAPLSADAGSQRTILPVIPYPAMVERQPGFFRMGRGMAVESEGELETTAEFCADTVAAITGVRPDVRRISNAEGAIRLLQSSGDSSSETYTLNILQNSVLLTASAAAGFFYGIQTLAQLVYAGTIPCARIVDSPRFGWRGLMLDEARSFYGKEYVKRTIDLISRYKFNVFHWHLTDDQGWRIEIKKYPRLTEVGGYSIYPGTNEKYGGFYTQKDIREIVAFAKERHVTIVPEIDMPGHIHSAMLAYPQYSCTGGPFEMSSHWGGFPDPLCPGKDESIEFVKDILTEVMDLFPSPSIHTGGDECTRTRWRSCPHCQGRVRKEGLGSAGRLQSWFSSQISAFLAGHGRRMIGWEEVGDGGLPANTALEIWIKQESLMEYARGGTPVINALDFPGTHDRNGRTGMSGYAKTYAYDPAPASLGASASNVIGVEAHQWTEGLRKAESADWNLWPDPCVVSELAWSPAAKGPFDEFASRLQYHVEALSAEGLRFSLPIGSVCASWKPEMIAREFRMISFEIPRSFVSGSGQYEFQFNYTKGKHGIDLAWVALEINGKQIQDAHNGFAGGRPHDHTYRMQVDSVPAFARIRLAASVRGNGGTDSNGEILCNRRIPRPG